jgi:hypothetical protein
MADRAPMSIDPESGMKEIDKPAPPSAIGHHLPANDPDNPMNWPMTRRIYVSLVSWVFTAVV